MALASLIHQKFPLDKAPPQPPFQTHFCGMYVEQFRSRKIIPSEVFFCCGFWLWVVCGRGEFVCFWLFAFFGFCHSSSNSLE